MKKKWNLYNLSESRGILMGVATLIVAFFHCFRFNFENVVSNKLLADFLNYLRNTGNIGVDIFLFLSAIGLYFSFSKDSNLKNFYKKRLLRIIPSIVIVATIYYLYKGVSFGSFISNVTLVSFYINGNREFWYFSLIIVLYLLFPLFYKIINDKGLKGLLALLFIFIGSTILLFKLDYSLYSRIEIALTRVPCFFLGIYVGEKVKNKVEINELLIILFFISFIVCNYVMFKFNITPYMIVRYIYCVLGISIVFVVSYIHSKVKYELSDKFLVFIGTYSMEVYLIFQKLSTEVSKLSWVHIKSNALFYLIMFIITMILSFILKKICNFITNIKLKKE